MSRDDWVVVRMLVGGTAVVVLGVLLVALVTSWSQARAINKRLGTDLTAWEVMNGVQEYLVPRKIDATVTGSP